MQFPTVVPQELRYVESATSDETLFDLLVQKPFDLVEFFEAGADDETWAEAHATFMNKTLKWVTAQTYSNKLAQELVDRTAHTVLRHHRVLNPYLPNNITLKLSDVEIPANSFMLSAGSNYLRNLMLKECRDKNSNVLVLNKIKLNEFTPIMAYVNTEDVEDILTMGQDDLINIIKISIAWDIQPLSALTQKLLAKYLTDQNIIAMIFRARQEHWLLFERHCAEYLNNKDLGFSLEIPTLERFVFAFYDFKEDALHYFEIFKPLITDLSCKGTLSEDQYFGKALKRCPNLIGVNLSKTLSFSPQLVELPSDLQEMNLSECPWISPNALKQLHGRCPDLKFLDFTSDIHLNFSAWGELVKFKQLKRLSLAQCHQLQDSDIAIILTSCKNVTRLSLRNCVKISEKGFLDIAKSPLRLIELDLSRCVLTDNTIVEIGSKCKALAVLDISNCDQLTEKGILGLVRNARMLTELNITRCHISPSAIEEMKRIAPQLKLVH